MVHRFWISHVSIRSELMITLFCKGVSYAAALLFICILLFGFWYVVIPLAIAWWFAQLPPVRTNTEVNHITRMLGDE